jgi:hypothetical protein
MIWLKAWSNPKQPCQPPPPLHHLNTLHLCTCTLQDTPLTWCLPAFWILPLCLVLHHFASSGAFLHGVCWPAIARVSLCLSCNTECGTLPESNALLASRTLSACAKSHLGTCRLMHRASLISVACCHRQSSVALLRTDILQTFCAQDCSEALGRGKQSHNWHRSHSNYCTT